jgi:hypothetical protein
MRKNAKERRQEENKRVRLSLPFPSIYPRDSRQIDQLSRSDGQVEVATKGTTTRDHTRIVRKEEVTPYLLSLLAQLPFD